MATFKKFIKDKRPKRNTQSLLFKRKRFCRFTVAGVDGRLFGSVTNHDIADELKKQGFDVHKSQVRLPNGPIKTVGDNTVEVSLHTDVDAEITVSVYGETA